jgi:hypothetical protein
MHKYKLLLIGSALSCAAVLLAQTLPSTLPLEHRSYLGGSSGRRQPARQTSCVGGKVYCCYLEDSGVSADWQPPALLPLGWAKVEQIARTELRKLVQDEPNWLVIDFRVSRFERSPGWYYAITLKPEIERITLTPAIKLVNEPPQSYTLLVDFSGTPGKTGWLATPKAQQ